MLLMASAKLARFVSYLQERGLIDGNRIRRSYHQFQRFDRRIGQLAAFLGYIRPESINQVLLDQARTGGRFGECAMRLNLLTGEQIDRLLRLQKDDLSLFSQAMIGIQKSASAVEFTSYLTDFMRDNPEDAFAVVQAESADQIHDSVRSILATIEHISPLPETVDRVIQMLDDPAVNLDEVAQVLKLDAGLTATLLKVANSAFYGLRTRIDSTKKALQVLGTDKLRQLIIVVGIMQKYQSVPSDYIRQFWEQSLRSAEFCKEIGKYCRIAELDELFICGLLHNIGEMVTRQFLPAQWEKIHDSSNGKKNLFETERENLGGTHADLGGFLFHIWGLPRQTVQSAMFHHHDFHLLVNTPNVSDEVFIVHMASTIAALDPNLNAFAYSKMLDVIADFYRSRLNYPAILDLNAVLTRVDAAVERLDQFYFK